MAGRMSTTAPPLGASLVIVLLPYIIYWLINFKNQIRSIFAGSGPHLSGGSSGLPKGFTRSSPGAKSRRRNSFPGCGLGRQLRELWPLDLPDASLTISRYAHRNSRVKKPIRCKGLSLGAQLIERF